MIDQFNAKTKGKTLVVKVSGCTVLIGEPLPGKKPKLIDMAFGNHRAIIQDLKAQGFNVKLI